ncbi:DUF3592 domain-containing protein [Spirochaeta isovalerica]|uniref:DUF3592 domain-containing protein n=1 Tax=Spirochaeta isovalerica TaxID=150 RepID=A0A841RKA9_9SPIO|nr:DUF3592 domain-containing protein [Spirochaeta isovalerica]MBB6482702.1 hypothetical protein [Spirochaeta isovalerica]
MSSNIIKIASIVFISIGILLIIVPVQDFLYKAKETNNYLKTTCEITRLEKIRRPKGGYDIVLQYKYEVNGVIYKSSSFSNGVGDKEDFYVQYPMRKSFPAYYDPDNHKKSVLVLGGRKYFLNASIIMGIILIFFGIVGSLSNKNKIFKEIWNTFLG